MRQRLSLLLLAVTISVQHPLTAQAHFLWLVQATQGDADRLHVYFAELPEADDPDLLDRILKVQVWQLGENAKPRRIQVKKGSDSLVADLGKGAADSIFVLGHDLGVISRGGETFLLRYYAKSGPELNHPAWREIDGGKHLDLDIVPRRDGDKIQVTVKWRGEPRSGAQVTAQGPGMKPVVSETDAKGQVHVAVGTSGVYSLRARYIEEKGGESGGQPFKTTRHYSTLALNVNAKDSNRSAARSKALPPIPQMVTSFGAAIADQSLYIYGGHTGGAHSYSKEAQAHTLRRLDLKNPKSWESLGDGPGLQGLAMVAHQDKLYRMGGFAAKNKEGEDHELWSQDSVACYDPATRKWTNLDPLPEPRSSFDAAVLGDKIYVVGGWKLAGEAEAVWHDSASVLDLSAKSPRWQAVAKPPFKRRALSVAAHDGKIYAIGGMQAEGGPTTRTDVFDPQTNRWSQGPSLKGKPMDGFGSSSFATGGRLYATTYSGKLQQLSTDGSSWNVVAELERARFFHRMLPLSQSSLITLGGASMSVGKFEELDAIDVSPFATDK